MWHLEFLSPVQEGAYIAMFLEQMKINRDNISIKSVKKYLTDDLLREILISRPQKLYGMCEDLKSHLFRTNNTDLLSTHIEKKNDPDPELKKIA